jgi:tetratricopeptide (TPR) repeat protein
MESLKDKVDRAVACLNAADWPGAESACREILAADPVNGNALRVLGIVARNRGELAAALDYLRRAVQLYDRSPLLQFELGAVYTALHRHEEAFDCYRLATELDPKFQEAYLNLSAVMEQQERFEEAVAFARQAVALKPSCSLSHYNLANGLREQGQVSEAIEHYTQSLRARPDWSKARWNLGLAELLVANYPEGWPLYESRQDAREVLFDHYPQPRWDGSSLAGKTILVHAEQGLGDEILFGSCFPDLILQAGRTILVCEPRLESLFARSFRRADVRGYARQKDRAPLEVSEHVDFQIPAGSLPLFLRKTAADFPRRKRFLVVDSELESLWRERFAALGPELKVGISWRAGGKPVESRKRSLTLEQLLPLLSVPGVKFVNLQYGDASREIAELHARTGIEIHDWEDGDPLVDVDSFAAKISALDLVISVGNATVHLAGAVGASAWTLLPLVPSWRWMLSGNSSPWYTTVRLFRQPQHGAWQPVLDQVVEQLRALAGGADSSRPRNDRKQIDSTARVPSEAQNRRWFGAQDLLGHEVDEPVKRLLSAAKDSETIGDLPQAEASYREILQLAPRYIDAWCGLGIVSRKLGRTDAAIRAFRRALSATNNVPAFHLHLADALLDAARHEEALDAYRRALELDPSLWAARRQIGLVLQRLDRHADAVEELNRGLLLNPQSDEILLALGHSFTQLCRIDDAIDCFEGAVQARPDSVAALEALASAYLDDQRRTDAEKCYRRMAELQPTRSAAQANLGKVLESLGQNDAAVGCYARALQLDPTAIDISHRLASLHRQAGNLAAAAELLAESQEQRPADARIQNLLGVVLRESGEPELALEQFDRALGHDQGNAELHFNRSLALLQSVRLAEGWSGYRWRWHCAAAEPARVFFAQPEWDGSPLAGKHVLIHAEQSCGEEILFSSCYGDLIERAASCYILCDPRLQRLFERSFPTAQIAAVSRGREAQWKAPSSWRADLQIAAGDLPRHCRATSDSFPQRGAYLTADLARTTFWRQRYAALGAGMKVGIAWRDAGANVVARHQAPALNQWRPLWSLPGIQWISLLDSPEDHRESAAVAHEQGAILHHFPQTDPAPDFDDFAARIAALDVVIVVGGVPAHLAGALDVPTTLLGATSDWQWLSTGDATPWYRSVRLARPDRESWSDSILRLSKELLKQNPAPTDEIKMGVVRRPHWLAAAFGHLPDSRRSGSAQQASE